MGGCHTGRSSKAAFVSILQTRSAELASQSPPQAEKGLLSPAQPKENKNPTHSQKAGNPFCLYANSQTSVLLCVCSAAVSATPPAFLTFPACSPHTASQVLQFGGFCPHQAASAKGPGPHPPSAQPFTSISCTHPSHSAAPVLCTAALGCCSTLQTPGSLPGHKAATVATKAGVGELPLRLASHRHHHAPAEHGQSSIKPNSPHFQQARRGAAAGDLLNPILHKEQGACIPSRVCFPLTNLQSHLQPHNLLLSPMFCYFCSQ